MKNGVIKKSLSIIITFAIAFGLLAFISILKPGYLSPANVRIISISIAVLGLTALGQTFPILTGGMDLSIPWMFCIGAYLCAGLTGGDAGKLIYAIPAVLIVGLLMGTVNGFGIAYVGIAPVIMTMATNIIYQGVLLGVTKGTPGGAYPECMKELAKTGPGIIGWLFVIWLVISVVAWMALTKTPYGRKIYAVGNSETCSLYSGISVKFIKMSSYSVCGMMAALSGMLYAGKVSQLYLGMGDTYQMASVSAVAIGGVSLAGGSGSYIGAMAGAFMIVILDGVLVAMDFSQGVQKIIYGIVLFVAVWISSKKKNSN